jgi:hypothetical protein
MRWWPLSRRPDRRPRGPATAGTVPSAGSAGGFDAAETTTRFSPIIVEIEASTEGRTSAVRVVYSPREEFTAFGEPDAAMALFAAMRKATNALVRKLGES